jgi:hypothetical protein
MLCSAPSRLILEHDLGISMLIYANDFCEDYAAHAILSGISILP